MTWLTTAAHGRWLEQETDRLLAFARRSRLPAGFGSLAADGTVPDGAPVELYVTCRMTHCFALGALLGRPGAGPLVDHGLAALDGLFRDAEHGTRDRRRERATLHRSSPTLTRSWGGCPTRSPLSPRPRMRCSERRSAREARQEPK